MAEENPDVGGGRTPEREQLISLVSHLEKERKRRLELEKKTQELEEELAKIKSELEKTQAALEDEHEKRVSTEEKIEKMQQTGMLEQWAELLDTGWDDADFGKYTSTKKNAKSLLKLLLRVGRIKSSMASSMLDVNRDVIDNWASLLGEKNLIRISNKKSGDYDIEITDYLRDRIKRLREKLRVRESANR